MYYTVILFPCHVVHSQQIAMAIGGSDIDTAASHMAKVFLKAGAVSTAKWCQFRRLWAPG